MATKFVFNGTEFTSDTPAEAAALYRELSLRSSRTTTKTAEPSDFEEPSVRPANGSAFPAFPEWTVPTAHRFLTAIRDGGPGGIASDAVMAALKTDKPKAVGGRSAIINKMLRTLGYPQKHVYDNPRTANGRHWVARKQLLAAIAALEQRMAAK